MKVGLGGIFMFGGDGTLGKSLVAGAWAKTERKNRGIIDAKTPKEANFIPLPNHLRSRQSMPPAASTIRNVTHPAPLPYAEVKLAAFETALRVITFA
jgi:hypothetical protein